MIPDVFGNGPFLQSRPLVDNPDKWANAIQTTSATGPQTSDKNGPGRQRETADTVHCLYFVRDA